MKEMPSSTRNWRDSLAHTQKRSNRIWKEGLLSSGVSVDGCDGFCNIVLEKSTNEISTWLVLAFNIG